jgi:hypothetical protein
MIRLNIGHRLESVSTPTIINDTATPRQRLKRPRLEVDDDDDVVVTNGNGH